MKQGFGLSNLALIYAEHCPQICIRRIFMNSQLLLLSGNNHKVVSDHTNIHGKGNHRELFYSQAEDQDLQVSQTSARSAFKIQLFDYFGVEQKFPGKKEMFYGAFAER